MSDVPLIRTEGKSFANGTALTPDRFLQDPTLLRASKTDPTREVEAAFDLGDCLYMYVGHACPDFGDVVLIYDPTWSESQPGSATPFDTGGLYHGHIHADGLHDDATRKDYVSRNRVELAGWRMRFRAYLADHFASAKSYVQGKRATTDDPSHRLHDVRNQRRAWTWELQLHADHPLFNGLLRCVMASEFYEMLRIKLSDMPPDEAAVWNDRIDKFVEPAPPASEAPIICQMAEERVTSWL